MRNEQVGFARGTGRILIAPGAAQRTVQQHHAMASIKDLLDSIFVWASDILIVVGGLYLAKAALSTLVSLYSTFLRPGKNLKKYGAWAVVTGATGKLRSMHCCHLLFARVCLACAQNFRHAVLVELHV